MQTLEFDSIEEIGDLIENLEKIANRHFGHDVEEFALGDIRRAWEIAIEGALDGKEIEGCDDPCALLGEIGHPFCVNDGLPDESMRFDEWDEDYWGVNLTYGFHVNSSQCVKVKHSITHESFREIGLDAIDDYIQRRNS